LHVQYQRDEWQRFAPVVKAMTGPHSVKPGYGARYSEFNGLVVSLFASYVLNGLDAPDKYQEFLNRLPSIPAGPLAANPMVLRPDDLDFM
jgi:hypothetical protein